MLFSTIIAQPGAQTLSNDWTIDENPKFHSFALKNSDLRQMIRFGHGIGTTSNLIVFDENATSPDKANVVGVELHLEKNAERDATICFSNSYVNMSLSAMKRQEALANTVGEFKDVVYITLENANMKLLRYTLEDRDNTDIIQTYRKHDTYQGCAIGFNADMYKDSEYQKIMTLDTKNLVTGRYERYKIGLEFGAIDTGNGEEESYWVTLDAVDRLPKQDLRALRKVEEQYAGRFLSFKITLHNRPFPTMLYIVPKDKCTEELQRTLNENAPCDINILTVADEHMLDFLNADNLDNLSGNDAKIHSKLMKEICDNRMRAVTVVDMDVPRSFCKTYRILYLFKHMTDKGYTFCLRSN